MKAYILSAALLLCMTAHAEAQNVKAEEAPVRELITEWNRAYRAMDAKALAALFTSDAEIIDRFGHLVRSEGPVYMEHLWHFAFTQIYKGKPGPERQIQHVRMLSPETAIVQATGQWDAVTLDDGTKIPPHGEIDTFVVVKTNGQWRITALNIHNQMPPGSERPGEKVPVIKQ